jgi:CzcA family heavy metal efflux pump
MSLAHFVGRRRRSLLTLLLMLVVGGVIAAVSMPVSLFPNVRFPRIDITVDAGDRPVDQMEAVVTRPVEQVVRAVPGIRDLRSTTSRGSAELSVDFGWGSDMYLALQRVQAALTQLQPDLPQDVRFNAQLMDPASYPMAAYSLTSPTATPIELRRFADRVLAPMLTTVDGVAKVDSQGGAVGEYRVTADPARLAAYGLSLADLGQALSNSNLFESVGRLQDRGKLFLVFADARLSDPLKIGDVVVRSSGGAVVRVRDVASVDAQGAPQWIRVTADGHDAVLINIYQQRGGNTVKIRQDLARVMQRARLLGPADMRIGNWYDQSRIITGSAGGLRDAIVIGVILAALVLLVFLRNWKVTLAAVIAVPATLAATTLILRIMGQSFNIMTLGGMAAAIGLIIDDAIVMIEHIERRLAGAPDHSGARVQSAAAEFLRPLFSSSAATTVIFIPLAFLTGVTGAFFKVLSITMAVALLLSFLTAWWIVPVVVERFVAGRARVAALNPDGPLMSRYRRALETAVGRRWLALAAVVGLMALGAIAFTRVGTGFMPQMDEGGFTLDYVAPPGMSLTETDRLLRQVEAIVGSTPDVLTYSRRTGAQLGGFLTEPNTGDFFIRLKSGKRRPIETVMNEITSRIQSTIPGLEIETSQLMEDEIGDLTGAPQPIEVKLYGASQAVLHATGRQVAKEIGQVKGVTEIKSGVVIAGDGLDVQIDPQKAAIEGIDPAEAGRQISDLLSGNVATQVQSGAYLVGVRAWIPSSARARVEQIGDQMLKAADGHLFSVSRIATVRTLTGQAEVHRENMREMDAVTARVLGRPSGSAAKDVQALVARQGLPPGVTFEMGGLYAQQQAAFRGMAMVFAAAVAAVFVLLLFIYESFRVAFAILLMPLAAATAVALGLWITHVELNIMALMGMTMIVGIVTEVAIFYFTEYESLLAEGVAPERALIEAGVNRLRPITMTTLAAILALTPLALALGRGSEMERPLAVAIIAGLIAGGPLVLLAMPAFYRLIGGVRSDAGGDSLDRVSR